MAFSGYPDKECNRLGMALTRFWMASGDIIRDMGKLFTESGWKFQEKEIGGLAACICMKLD